jgi:hypothetical protein
MEGFGKFERRRDGMGLGIGRFLALGKESQLDIDKDGVIIMSAVCCCWRKGGRCGCQVSM